MKAFLAVLTLLFLFPFLGAAERAPELVFEASGRYEGLARQLGELPRERLEFITALVGLEDPGPPIRVILAPENSLEARVPGWVAGYALGSESTIVLLPARSPSYPDKSFEDLLRHEVAHILIDRAARDRPVPRWFHEGVAMIAGGAWGLEDRTQVTLALLTEGDVALAEVERRFRGARGDVGKAYAVAGSFVQGLYDEHGPDVAAEILAGVRHGLPFPDAFEHATGSSLVAAEREFQRRLSLWYRWVPLLTSSTALWLAITLLALWAIRSRRARDAARLRRWEEEERRAAEAALLRELEGQGPVAPDTPSPTLPR